MFKVNNKDTKTTPWRRFGVFIVNFEHISHLCSNVSIVNFEQVNAGWALTCRNILPMYILENYGIAQHLVKRHFYFVHLLYFL